MAGHITSHTQAENFFLTLHSENISSVGPDGAGLPHTYTDALRMWEQANYKPLSYSKPETNASGMGPPSFEARLLALEMGKRKEGAPWAPGGMNKRKRTGSNAWCSLFNTSTGCPNATMATGCIGPDGLVIGIISVGVSTHGCLGDPGNMVATFSLEQGNNAPRTMQQRTTFSRM